MEFKKSLQVNATENETMLSKMKILFLFNNPIVVQESMRQIYAMIMITINLTHTFTRIGPSMDYYEKIEFGILLSTFKNIVSFLVYSVK